jgi:large subunit ribosomal protein L19
MQGKQQLIAELDRKSMKKSVPDIKTGHTVRVQQKIKEGDKERVQTFEGLVIKVHGNGGLNTTISVRKISEGIGVEKIFPIHSPTITEIQIIKIAKVRRSKLYYMRDRSGKSARLQETQTTPTQRKEMMIHFEELKPQTEKKETQKESPKVEAKKEEAKKETKKAAPKAEEKK